MLQIHVCLKSDCRLCAAHSYVMCHENNIRNHTCSSCDTNFRSCNGSCISANWKHQLCLTMIKEWGCFWNIQTHTRVELEGQPCTWGRIQRAKLGKFPLPKMSCSTQSLIRKHLWICPRIYVHEYAHTFKCIGITHTHKNILTYMHTYTSTLLQIHISIHTCILAHTHGYPCANIHTYIACHQTFQFPLGEHAVSTSEQLVL